MTFASFKDIIDLWPSPSVLNADLGARYNYVNIWKRRNSIPPQYWSALVKAARRRGFTGVTLDVLSSLAER